ncbi:DUF6795 domain-containing protein [Roseibium sp. RKSG952]|uniref:DUF6795 domain-containing protein n=1 Tax=Roseibium sp. RKSG952 TaxID=2529384 RepID=UPI0012BD0A99|nr:DUF6795 domain-containing protein [Roseibium sp. RKSG952]MTH95362.1 hypothetical protein [Roseibium sp. RKSG952]
MSIILFCMAAIIILSTCGWAAAKNSGPRVYASRAKGTVTRNSEPQPGMIVTRRVSSLGYDRVQKTRTDWDGVFRFPELTERYDLTDFLPLPGEVRVDQTIQVENEDGSRSGIWTAHKRDFERNSELGYPIKLLCDLGDGKCREEALAT